MKDHPRQPQTTTKHPSWLLGYEHASNGLVASMVLFPSDIDWGEYNVGYAIGARDKRSNDIMDEWEAANAR